MRNYVLGENMYMRNYVLYFSDKVGANTKIVYVLNKHRETYKSRKLPICRSVNICEGPIQLKVQHCGTYDLQNIGEPT